MTMTKTRAWIAGAVAVSLLLAVAAWFLLISPQRAEAADSREMTVSAQSQNAQLRSEITRLKAEYAQLPQYEAELAAIQRALPEAQQVDLVTRDLNVHARANNVQLFSVTYGDPVVFENASAPAVAAAPPAGEAGTAPAAPASTPGVLVQIPITIVSNGNFQSSEGFLRSVQQDVTRDVLVTRLSITPASAQPGFTVANGDVTITSSGFIFAYVDAASAPASGAAASTATTPSGTSSSGSTTSN